MTDVFDKWLLARPKDDSAASETFAAGTCLGEYRVTALLGRGGFAEVYRAEDADGHPVAVKILRRLDDKSRRRFEREAQILSQVRHPNMPRMLSFGSAGDRPYVVTELLCSYDLPHKDREVARFLKTILSAVETLHAHGYVHRDIKPANILMRPGGEPVLIDFGLVCPISKLQYEEEALSMDEGCAVAVGTVGYSAPEQFSGLAAGRAADVHAVGALIPACLGERMPPCWRRIYLTATNSNPSARYATVSLMRAAVQRRHGRRTAAVLGLSVMFALFAGLTFFAVNGYKSGRNGKRIDTIIRQMPDSFTVKHLSPEPRSSERESP